MGRQRDTRAEESADPRAEKVCGSCGRRIEWRAKWARDWEAVRWCSDACRARGVRPVDRALEESIRSLLADRAAGATICPSEAARAVAGDQRAPTRPVPTLAMPSAIAPSAGASGTSSRNVLDCGKNTASRYSA